MKKSGTGGKSDSYSKAVGTDSGGIERIRKDFERSSILNEDNFDDSQARMEFLRLNDS